MAAQLTDLYGECVLPVDKRMIRVLDLKPGYESDEIQAYFRLLDLDTHPLSHYECVSYVWGDPSFTERATINKQYIRITKNLHDALRHIRSNTESVVIWADAICINQSDMDEKSQQVAIMAEIYRQCSKVHIWLGQPEPGSLMGDPFEFLDHFIQGKHFFDFPGFDRDRSTGRWAWRENEACDNLLNDFLQIVKSPWWTRAWTVQECLLPKKNVVMFGTWTVTWDYILRAGYMKNDHGDGPTKCCVEANTVFNPHQLGLINGWMWHPTFAERFRHVVHGNSPQPPRFYETLLSFSSRKCSDPRDKIYSLLALARHPIYKGYKPNYHDDVSTVYTDIFTRMIHETGGSFHCFMGGGFGSSMKHLPSWVRDFSQIRDVGVIAGEERRIWYATLYQASLESPVPVQWNENKELHYKGTYISTVKDVGPCMSTSHMQAQKPDWGEVFRQWLDLCKEAMSPYDPAVLRNTFSRIICGDVCKDIEGGDQQFRRAKETDLPEKNVWDRLMTGDIYAADMRSYGWGLNFAMWGRCLFTTNTRKMGLCHPTTLPGDEVWIMTGVQVPFVVRPLHSADAGCADNYSFVGDCFLHGVMDGEFGEKEKSMGRTIVMN